MPSAYTSKGRTHMQSNPQSEGERQPTPSLSVMGGRNKCFSGSHEVMGMFISQPTQEKQTVGILVSQHHQPKQTDTAAKQPPSYSSLHWAPLPTSWFFHQPAFGISLNWPSLKERSSISWVRKRFQNQYKLVRWPWSKIHLSSLLSQSNHPNQPSPLLFIFVLAVSSPPLKLQAVLITVP